MTEPAYDLIIRGGRVATVSDVKAALENLARRSKATEAWDLDAEPWT